MGDQVVARNELISAEDFAELGLTDWRYLRAAIHARFGTGDFLTSLRLANRIGEAAEELNHHPDLDVRYGRLDVKLSSHDTGGVTPRDLDLARTITDLAAAEGCTSRPSELTMVELALDAPDMAAIKPFWRTFLGMVDDPRDDENLIEKTGQLPTLWFQTPDAVAEPRQRFHLDVFVPPDQAEARVAAVIAAGGRLVSDEAAPSFWVLADRDGNQGCVCTALKPADGAH
ncbi:MAG: 4a-hydroxytetrahydrobiopterin dehydratase [Nocardioides sp.]